MIVTFWYALVPIAGGFLNRYKWKKFRNRFNELRLKQLLDYRKYRQLEREEIFRFSGNIESITDGRILWVKGDDLSISVSLTKTICYLLPKHEGEELPEAPEQIRWNRVSTLSEGSKVFIGGMLKRQNNRFYFKSTKEQPLMVIFYSCPDSELSNTMILAARTRNEYWNGITPVSLAIGALILIYIASSFLGRPAFRLTVITALLALFIPILPVFPPGLLLTVLYRRLTWNARKLRAFWDVSRFGLLPIESKNKNIPAVNYAFRAYMLELAAWLLMIIGLCANIVFIYLILILFNVISF